MNQPIMKKHFPLGFVQVDKFVLGGYEQNKVGRSYDAKKREPLLRLILQTTNLITKMDNRDKIYQSEIICS